MTEAELRAFVADARRQVDEALAEMDAVDPSAFPPAIRAEYDADRAHLIELRAQLTDEAIAAELEATEHAGRELTPAEIAALLRRQ